MTTRLDAIRERHKAEYGFAETGEIDCDRAFADIAYLLEEVGRWQALYASARNYINLSPCDPDITKAQTGAWLALLELEEQQPLTKDALREEET